MNTFLRGERRFVSTDWAKPTPKGEAFPPTAHNGGPGHVPASPGTELGWAIAGSLFFDFTSLDQARKALTVAKERDVQAELLTGTEAAATIAVPQAELLQAEVLLLRHRGHLREQTASTAGEEASARTATLAPPPEA
ncbi:hypothetical protein AAEX63_06650 [Luteococcus sp. H138]|uniref:hypothetical protein n=1 Tax=unclassified Luteococcus TaxID=2639923 RepID=UPI00313B515A